MEEHYTESVSDSEAMRQMYAASVDAAVEHLYRAAKQRRLHDITPCALLGRREELRTELRQLLGVDLCFALFGARDVPCDATFVGEDSLCRIERLHLAIAQDVFFGGLLLIPHQRTERMPLAVMIHGGGGSPELCCDLVGDNNYGGVVRALLMRGYMVFAPQLLLWNLNPKLCESNIPFYQTAYDRKGSDNKMKHCGASIAGFEIFCIMRAMDHLLARPDVDPVRCGMLGLSYGGFYTLYTMACDTRIRCGWSAACFNDRTRYAWFDWVWKNAAGRFLDAEVAGLCAPRRLILDVGAADTVFDASFAEDELLRAEAFFSTADALHNLTVNRWDGGHRFSVTSLSAFLL